MIIESLNKSKDVRAIILSGTGKHFCTGIDLKASFKSFQNFGGKDGLVKGIEHIDEFQKAIRAGVDSKIPIIGVLHGVCYGLALDLISATSIRLASADSRLSIKEIDIGIMADIGSLQRLPFVVNNISKLNQLALTGQDFYAKDSKEIGLVSEVYPNKEETFKQALEIANAIAKKYVPAVQGTKKHLDQMTVNNSFVNEGLKQVAIDNVKLMTNPGFGKFFVESQRKRKAKL